MAIYISEGTRRRRLLGIAGACLVAGLAVGGVVGRATSSGVDDAVRRVHEQAQDAITALQRLPIEYEQALAGQGGEDKDTVVEAVERARLTLDGAYDEIDVFGREVRQDTHRSLDTLNEVIANEMSRDDFEREVARAVALIQATFGLTER